MQEARYYRRENGHIYCELCPQACRLEEGQKGICQARFVQEGKLMTSNYFLCAALNFDPIEKKPLYHFYPGWEILSLGTSGCNLHCVFCQNWSLAHGDRTAGLKKVSSAQILDAIQARPLREQLGLAYTYNEPTVWYEFVLENAAFMAERGYKNVLVTNGLINPQPLNELLPYIHGMNIDVKAFNDAFYRRYCRGKGVQDVLRTVEQAHQSCHLELTYLVITSLNDDLAEIGRFVDWVASLDPEIPVHFSRYFPAHQLEVPPTSLETMETIYQQAREKLSYVYLGNVMDMDRSSTYCPNCGNLLIARRGYGIESRGIKGKSCTNCGNTIRLEGHIYGEKEY